MASTPATIDDERALLGPFRVEFTAGTDERTAEYQLRHATFVHEYGWLDDDGSGRGLEKDEYDDYSVSFLLRDADSGDAAACQRLILPDCLPAGMTTQIEHLAGGHSLPSELDRHTWAEVSRTTVARSYRWGSAQHPAPAMRAIKHASIALAEAVGRTRLFSVSDPRTARLVRRMGFTCRQFGGPVRYHGKRVLYSMDMHEIRQSVPRVLCEALNALTERARADVGRPREQERACA